VQKQRETNNKTFYLDEALSTLDENPGKSTAILRGSDNRLNVQHISPNQKVLQWPNKPEGELKRKTERVSFVITCKEWKTVFRVKENTKEKRT
jgi:hypothetical protein